MNCARWVVTLLSRHGDHFHGANHPMTADIQSKKSSVKRPHVAVVYHFFAHYREPIVERLARSEVADFVFCGDDHDYENTIKKANFSPKVDFRFCRTHKIFRSIMWQSGIIRIALSREFDQIIFLGNAFWIATWIAAIMARLTGKRVLYWSHGFLQAPQGLKGLLRRSFFALAHAHLFYGRFSKQEAITLGWDPSRLHVVGNSLNLDAQTRERNLVKDGELAALRQRLFKDPSLPIAFCSCRLQPSKRLDLLVSALAKLAQQGTRANLLIVGDGSQRADLERLAKESGIDAHFTGACYDDAQLARYICASDVTVSPGFVGLTAIHSMVFGVPVITHDTMAKQAPEVEAIIPGVTGDLFALGNVDDLARCMKSWLSPQRDRERTRQACIQLVERFWSPAFQQMMIEHAVLGYPADDLLFLRQPKVRNEPT